MQFIFHCKRLTVSCATPVPEKNKTEKEVNECFFILIYKLNYVKRREHVVDDQIVAAFYEMCLRCFSMNLCFCSNIK